MKFDKFKIKLNYDEETQQLVTRVSINNEDVRFYTDLFQFFKHYQSTASRETEVIGRWKLRKASTFEPFTCSCGQSGCAGIWGGIYQKTRKWTTEWKIFNKVDNGYDFLDKSHYTFQRSLYELEVLRAWEWCKNNQNLIVSEDYYQQTIGDLLINVSFWMPEQFKILNEDSKSVFK